VTCHTMVTELDNLCTKEKHAKIIGMHGIRDSRKTLFCKALYNIRNFEFVG
jgi:hypothetical protein